MADIPLISTTPGAGEDAPDAANFSLNPAIVAVNLLNDTTIPALQANAVSAAAAIVALQNEVGVGQKISQMTAGGALQNGDLLPIERGGNNFSILGSSVLSGGGAQQVILSRSAGIDPTGASDSWAGFVAAYGAALAAGLPLVIDCKCLLTIGINDARCIFVRSGTYLLGTPGGELIADNSYIPFFVLHHTTDFVIRNLNIRYIGGAPWDDTIGPYPALLSHFNDVVMKGDMAANFGNTFSGSGSSNFTGHTNPQAIFRIIGGVTRGLFDNVHIYVPQGANAANFVPVAFSLDAQWLPNTLVPNNNQAVNATTAIIPSDLDVNNCRIDGGYMGIVGQGGIRITNLVSIRYSDLQKSDGTGAGGNALYFAPPHLIYLSDPDPSFVNWQRKITDTYDYGQYVGGATRRASTSGSLLSLKIAPCLNTVVDGYVSLRPDGFTDILTNNFGNQFGSMKNLYFTYDTSVVTSDAASVWGVRFPSINPYNYLTIENMTGRDVAASPKQFPIVGMTNVNNQNCDFKGVKMYLNTWPTGSTAAPGFSMSGNNMTLDADYYFNSYDADQTFTGSMLNQGSALITNSDVNIRVHGYRLFPVVFATPPSGTSTPLLANWGHSTGLYLLQFSDNEVRYATLTNAATTCTWAATGGGALAGTATTGASGTGTVATVTFSGSGGAAAIGSSVTISGVTPAGYNGTFTVTASQPGSVSFANATTGAQTVAGTIGCFVNATAQNVLGPNYAGYKQRMLLMQGGKAVGNRIRIMDVTNGLESICENGCVTDNWSQVWSGTPPAGLTFDLPISIPATHNPDRAAVVVTTSLGVSGGLTSFALGWAATSAALLNTIAPGAGASTTALGAPVTTNAGTLRTLRLTATGGTGFDGTGALIVSVRSVSITGAG
jgi:hypothetical protein